MNTIPSSQPITLNGHLLNSWQRGRRRYAIESTRRLRLWYPKSLLTTVLRHAIYGLSQASLASSENHVEQVTSNAVANIIAAAKSPGLDVANGTDTYRLTMDLCATVRTVIEYASRLSLLTLHEHVPVELHVKNLHWSFLSYPDDSGVLHRWEFVDHIDPDQIYKSMHSWSVIGDVIVGRVPMMLHLVSVGHTLNSRRISPWCRAYKSPVIPGLIRFKRHSGTALKGDWKPIWLADTTKPNIPAWVDQMQADDVTDGLMQHVTVNQPDPVHVRNFFRDVEYEYRQMSTSGVHEDGFDPMTLPMCRSACDTPYPCPHQFVCYSTNITLDSSGMYTRLARKSMTKSDSVDSTLSKEATSYVR